MSADRISIHAWWRSGSTYVWSKLRENDSCCCYYEPLHEKILRLSPDVAEQPPDSEMSRRFRHPIPYKSYFAEYADLLRSGNLKFSRMFCYERFLLHPDEQDDRLRSYIGGLIEAASVSKRTPVLCFCRSQMRSAWMKKTFGGIHIAQITNPADQWASFNVEPYFRKKMLTIALKPRQLQPLSFIHIEAFERFARHLSKGPWRQVEELFDRFISETDAFAVFLIIWIASTLQAISYSDFVLDIDAARAIHSSASPLVIAKPDVINKRLGGLSCRSGRALRLALGKV
jgi:hypothetical protein